MTSKVHAFDFLELPRRELPPVCVLFGTESFLKQLVRRRLRDFFRRDGEEALITTFNGPDAKWRDVADELSTVSLFGGGGPRVVLIDEGSKFVEQNRDRLEDYVARPRKNGVLILDVENWASNTRLYKAVNEVGLAIECRLPEKGRDVDEGRIAQWLRGWAQTQHHIKLRADAVHGMLELVGPTLGLLDQELAKLALYVKRDGTVNADLVRDVVGGWRTKTSFEVVNAAADGDAAEALRQLDRLIQAGQEPVALYGSISWTLRRLAAATRIYQASERSGRPVSVAAALQKAKVTDWPPGAFERAERQLKQLTRHRAGKLYRWLLELDLALKGSHSTPHRARLAVEILFLRLARQAAARR